MQAAVEHCGCVGSELELWNEREVHQAKQLIQSVKKMPEAVLVNRVELDYAVADIQMSARVDPRAPREGLGAVGLAYFDDLVLEAKRTLCTHKAPRAPLHLLDTNPAPFGTVVEGPSVKLSATLGASARKFLVATSDNGAVNAYLYKRTHGLPQHAGNWSGALLQPHAAQLAPASAHALKLCSVLALADENCLARAHVPT